LKIYSETTRNSPLGSRLCSPENGLGSPEIVSPAPPESTRRKSAGNRHWDRPESRLWPIGDAQYHPPEDRVSAGFWVSDPSRSDRVLVGFWVARVLSLGDLPLCFSLSLALPRSLSPSVDFSLSGPSLSLFSVSFDLPLSLTLCFTSHLSLSWISRVRDRKEEQGRTEK